MADEYLPFPMFYFRWTDDAEWCGRRQMVGWNGALDDAELAPRASVFAARQKAQLSCGFFLFGLRPSFAEFGLFGQLSQYAVDRFVSGVMKQKAVRVYQWTQLLDDLSGVEGRWAEPVGCLTPEVAGVIASMAPVYGLMMAMARRNADRAKLATALKGPEYRGRCLLALKAELADLSAEDVDLIRPVLAAAGTWDVLQFEGNERDLVAPILPA
ncbi:MAG: hypothetical protein R3E86_14600 [Pseudomonadales bacterium]